MDIEFFKRFPLLPPQSWEPFRAEGYIEVSGARVYLKISVSGAYSVDAIKSTPQIEEYLRQNQQELDTRLKQSTNAFNFVKELQHSLAGVAAGAKPWTSPYYSEILRELDTTVGWDHVEDFNDASQTLTLRVPFIEHHVYVYVYVDFPKEAFSSDIEEPATSLSVGLSRYLGILQKKCQQMQGPWGVLDQIDQTLCVLQPQKPRRFDLWRRLALGDLITGHLEMTSEDTYPRLTIYGPANLASPLNVKARELKKHWDASCSAKRNLEAVLGIGELPGPRGFDREEMKLDCGVCFAFEGDDGETADQVCPNNLCAQPFHRQCLIQWLTTKEDTRQSYNTYFGKCPYCSGNITVATSM